MIARGIMALTVCLLAALAAAPAMAQGQQRGDGSIRVEYQYIHTDKFYDDVAEYDYWTTDTQALLLSGQYAVTENWSIFAALPYVKKRFNSEVPWGGDPHNPNDPFWIDYVPTDKRFIDDGQYHGGLQDLTVGMSYVNRYGPLTLSPYVSYGTPVDDYPFYAKAAIGQDLWKVPVGVAFNYIPYFSDWYVNGNVAYVISEQPLDINVDYWSVHLSAGYWFRPGFSMNVFTALKYVRHGLRMPFDFTDDPLYGDYPDAFDTEEWYNHDRLLAHRNLNVGIGFDYFLSESYQVSGSGFTGVWTEQSSEPAYAFTLALTRHFGRR